MSKLTYLVLLTLVLLLGSRAEAQKTPANLADLETIPLAAVEKRLSKLAIDGDYQLNLEAANIVAKRLKKDAALASDSTYLAVLSNICDAYYDVSDFDNAEFYNLLLLEKSKNIAGGINKHQSAALNNLGIIYSEKSDAKKALSYCEQSLQIEEKLNGKQNLDYVTGLNNLGLLQKEIGNPAKTEALYLEGIDILKAINDTINDSYISLLNNLASFYAGEADFETGKIFISQALTISEKLWGATHPETARLYIEMGYFYEKMGELQLAEKSFVKGIAILKERAGISSQYYLNAVISLAQFYKDQDKFDLAIQYFKEVYDIETKFYADHPTRAADVAMRLATGYLGLPDSAKAEQYFWEAHDMLIANRAEKSFYYLEIINYLAAFYIQKNTSQSEKYLLQAINNNCGISATTLSLTQTLPLIENSEVRWLNEGLSGLDTWIRITTHNSAANFEHDNFMICKTALKIIDKELAIQTNEFSKLRLLVNRNNWAKRTLHWGHLAYQKQPNDTLFAQLYQIAESNKANLLLKNLQAEKNYTVGNLPDSIIQKEQELYSQYENLKAALLDADNAEKRKGIEIQINNLNIEIKNHRNYIDQKYPEYSNLKNTTNYADIKTIQQLLSDEDAVLMYVTNNTQNTVAYFYIDKKSSHIASLATTMDTLAEKTKLLREALTNYQIIRDDPKTAYLNFTAPAHWFYTQCIAPIPIGSHIQHLIIIPDGELAHLPFETFLTNAAPANSENGYKNLDYLIRKYRISYNYSATLWAENTQQPQKSNNNQILAMAAHYGSKPELSAKRSAQQRMLRRLLVPLPNAIEEVKNLSTFMSGDFISDTTSTEAKFKQIAPNYNIIHLATHGILDDQKPILSSLAFTEDGSATEDNFLRAHEISNLQLRANLVVLSACETGYGTIASGEGILSLARAFMYAGTPSLLVSMWEVNDGATAFLMQSYHQNLQSGSNKAAALQAAKLNYLQNVNGFATHPAFWAAFIQIGDTRPIAPATSYKLWYFISGGIAILGIIALVLRRRAK